jgi:chromosome partitioning protein
MKTIAFFNEKSGIGTTLLAFHVAFMLSELGYRCIAADLDPQCDLTQLCLDEEYLEEVYKAHSTGRTVLAGFSDGMEEGPKRGDVEIHDVRPGLGLIAGDLELALLEDRLGAAWESFKMGDQDVLRQLSEFRKVLDNAGQRFHADFCIIDLAPNFGALNRTILHACDYIVIPANGEVLSLKALRNVGEQIRRWNCEWQAAVAQNAKVVNETRVSPILPMGYVVFQKGIRSLRHGIQVRNYNHLIPDIYAQWVSGNQPNEPNGAISLEEDGHCLAHLRRSPSLEPMAEECNKPIFLLKPADGAIGGLSEMVVKTYRDYRAFVQKILEKTSTKPYE